jgi:hypothetical protein
MALKIQTVKVTTGAEIQTAFESLAHERPDALFVGSDALFLIRRVQLATLAARHGLPTSFPARDMVEAGGLMLRPSIVIIGFLPVYRRPTPGLTPGLAGRNRVGGTMGECDALARSACELVHTAGVA